MNREIKYWIAVFNLMYQEGEINLLERFSFYCRWIDYCHEFHEAFGDAKVPIDICWAINDVQTTALKIATVEWVPLLGLDLKAINHPISQMKYIPRPNKFGCWRDGTMTMYY